MAGTKADLVRAAYDNVGLARMPLTPKMQSDALEALERMMGRWSVKISLGYNQGVPGASDLNDKHTLPDIAEEAVVLSLALRLPRTFGKSLPPELPSNAANAYEDLDNWYQEQCIPTMQYTPMTPTGQGNKPYRFNGIGNFSPDPTRHLTSNGATVNADTGPLDANNNSGNPISGS